jgi:2-C-methyl-D-erythritol 4-phosphate cytidylyltransferase
MDAFRWYACDDANFARFLSTIELVVAMPEAHIDPWMDLCHTFHFHVPHLIAPAGETRFDTVRKSLAFLKENDFLLEPCLIGVHDAARPLVLPTDIDRVIQAASIHGAAALAVKSTDSVRIVGSDGSNQSVDRSKVYLMQTPQVFAAETLQLAYKQPYDPAFTDDASVVEKTGTSIQLVDGDSRNLKITFPEHIAFAEQLLLRSES